MFIDNLINKFGYSEMYEWSEFFKYDIVPYGRFVTFDENSPGKIRLADYSDYVIGVTTINSAYVSDNPDEWQGKYLCNEYGDILLEENELAIAKEMYDDELEFSYISTIKDKEVVPIINEEYDKSKNYVKRTDRNEWVRVNLIGKCIVTDNGNCVPGQYCTVSNNGIAIPSSNELYYHDKWYVIDRLTDSTIMIFFK